MHTAQVDPLYPHRHTNNKKTKKCCEISLPMMASGDFKEGGNGGLKCKAQAQLRHAPDLSQVLIVIEKKSEK